MISESGLLLSRFLFIWSLYMIAGQLITDFYSCLAGQLFKILLARQINAGWPRAPGNGFVSP
jgi:hypothetical protein